MRRSSTYLMAAVFVGMPFAACSAENTSPAPVSGSGAAGDRTGGSSSSGGPATGGRGGRGNVPSGGGEGGEGNAGAAPQTGGTAGSTAGAGGSGIAGSESDAGAGAGGAPDCGVLDRSCCPGFVCEGTLRCRGGVCARLEVTDFGEPCDLDAECVGGLCLPSTAGGHRCTARCASEDDCLSGWLCDEGLDELGSSCRCEPETETCNGRDDDCNGTVDDLAVTTPLCASTLGEGAVCVAGACECRGTLCDALCVDEQNDPFNCGACGLRCTIGCEGGECIEPVSIEVGQERGCALLSNGTVRCWGSNNGALGDGTSFDRDVATPLALTGVVQLDLGENHGCAVLAGGTLKCWGQDSFGVLGIGSAGGGGTPTIVPGLTDVVSVAPGSRHTCAVRAGGAVSCWGLNHAGQVGVPTNFSEPSPVDVPGLDAVVKLALGFSHSCALDAAGAVWCWGDNTEYQLGDGTNVARPEPEAVPGLAGATDLAAGDNHTCARLMDTTVVCWGDNASLQLGDGTDLDRESPTQVQALGGAPLDGIESLKAGGTQTLAGRVGGGVRFWGTGPTDSRNQAMSLIAIPLSLPLSLVDSNGSYLCVIDAGEIRCLLPAIDQRIAW